MSFQGLDRVRKGGHLSVVICGSFRRAQEQLQGSHTEFLQAGCTVLSPTSPFFVAEAEGFVYAEEDLGLEPHSIESRHLEALQAADFLWLHAPDGYVGLSAAMEIGFAHAVGLRIYASRRPNDVTLASFVEVVDSPADAVSRHLSLHEVTIPSSLRSLQRYYLGAAEARGYSEESPQDSMLLLTEEVGELARAVRKAVGLARSNGPSQNEVGEELADIQLYLAHLANVLGVDLVEAVEKKERRNIERFAAKAEQTAS